MSRRLNDEASTLGMIDRCLGSRGQDGVPMDPKVSTTPWCNGFGLQLGGKVMPGTAAAVVSCSRGQ